MDFQESESTSFDAIAGLLNGTCDSWLSTCWTTCTSLLISIIRGLLVCTTKTWDPSTEADDWSAILVFVIFVKCRHTIGKILRAEDDDMQ